ncbi:primosomal protein N' [Vagococcus intermedius]|uniref:Replication restart protein PriA n=1 Tax=Vagococcus intermedius TaxID=2991418 RepID=A0AAF0CUK2_9ENTE|nr:primosomal protein N' [Vagococcus intermedius]WEG73175.1 primosomal protein N' [Vagococcus intermedius]WEG75259.1 primosomal protein N' [Vagococcus intermedius]
MVYVAEVIVDVPAMQTDFPYTYLIPTEFGDKIQEGMRVEVPFGKGNRHVQGFVTKINYYESLAELAEFDMKEIVALLDLSPVLNPELLSLADEMKEKTYSFKITCLQTMLPSVMRAAYQKWLVLTDEVSDDILYGIFKGQDEITWEEAIASGQLGQLLKLRQQNSLDVRYEVRKRNRSKVIQAFRSRLSFERAEEERQTLRKGSKQKEALLLLLQKATDTQYWTIKQVQEEIGINRSTVKAGEKNGWLEIFELEIQRDPYAGREFETETDKVLNKEQQLAYDTITESMATQQEDVFLLQGITGSGKTEVYLQVIAEALKFDKTGIMLVPEISLTPQTVQRFKSRFGDEVAVLHSGLSTGEKYDEWRKIERKEARVVVGARSAIFAPLENIGVIIIDEEHETSYKQDETPRYHARDLAIWRSRYHHCPVVLGSATPSLESRARAQKGVYRLLKLNQRANPTAQLPTIKVVDLRHEVTHGNMQTFSNPLLEKIADRLTKKEQTVLMLNRRGYSSFVMCRECGFVLPCPNCDISLTLHMDTKKMKCHYCGHEEGIPHSCQSCGSKKIRYFGTGTQKVEEELQQLFPESRILRMDVDTTRKKGAHERLLKQFGAGEADILLGTQMIAKGLDFPNVTLVGVLNADTALNLPDFRSAEKTFQLLTQVSGRAGRAEKKGEVLIQTFNPQHYAIQLAQGQNYEQFYQREMQTRYQGNYPPFYYTVQLTASHEEENLAAKKMYEIVKKLQQVLSNNCIILGPTPKAVMRVNNRYFYQVVLKYKQEPGLSQVLKEILMESQLAMRQGLKITIDVEPQSFV